MATPTPTKTTCTALCGVDGFHSLCDGCRSEYCAWLDAQRFEDDAREARAWNVARRRHAEGITRSRRAAQLAAFLRRSLEAAA